MYVITRGLNIKNEDVSTQHIHVSCSLDVSGNTVKAKGIKTRMYAREDALLRTSTFVVHLLPFCEQGGQGQQKSNKMYETDGGETGRQMCAHHGVQCCNTGNHVSIFHFHARREQSSAPPSTHKFLISLCLHSRDRETRAQKYLPTVTASI